MGDTSHDHYLHLARQRSKGGGNELTEADETVVERVEELADKKGYTMTQVSMAWLLQKGAIPIIGFSKVERIDEALGVRGKTLTDEEMKYLEEPYKPKEISGHQ
jgi:aryl-alcohol dehydrogenase-like predicted oxidoreductase